MDLIKELIVPIIMRLSNRTTKKFKKRQISKKYFFLKTSHLKFVKTVRYELKSLDES